MMIDQPCRHEAAHATIAWASGFVVRSVQVAPEAFTDISFNLHPMTLAMRYATDTKKTTLHLVRIFGVLMVGSHVDGRQRCAGDDQKKVDMWGEAFAGLVERHYSAFATLVRVAQEGMQHWAHNRSAVEAIEHFAGLLQRQPVLSGVQFRAHMQAYLSSGRMLPAPLYALPAEPTAREPTPALGLDASLIMRHRRT